MRRSSHIFQREIRETKAVAVTASTSEHSGEEDHVGTIMVYTLQPCAPCEIVKEAMELLEDDARKLRWKIQIVPAILSDKKSVGAASLAGGRWASLCSL
jgi:hypothetical protein